MAAIRRLPIVVYDTGVIIQATLSPYGVAESALRLAETGRIEAIVNHHLRWEYEHILIRLRDDANHPQLLRPDVIETQLQRLDSVLLLVPNAPRQVTYRRDTSDEATIDLVLYTQADFLVARDKDLLALGNDSLFRRAAPQTQVVNPVVFLAAVDLLGMF